MNKQYRIRCRRKEIFASAVCNYSDGWCLKRFGFFIAASVKSMPVAIAPAEINAEIAASPTLFQNFYFSRSQNLQTGGCKVQFITIRAYFVAVTRAACFVFPMLFNRFLRSMRCQFIYFKLISVAEKVLPM